MISAAGGATVQRGDHGEWKDDPSWFNPMNPNGTIRYAVTLPEGGKLNDTKKPAHGYQVSMGLSWDLLGMEPPIYYGHHGELPTIGLAIVNYAQGDTQSISCWPETLTADKINQPSNWGKMQFLQALRPREPEGLTAYATHVFGDPIIDGKLMPGSG